MSNLRNFGLKPSKVKIICIQALIIKTLNILKQNVWPTRYLQYTDG